MQTRKHKTRSNRMAVRLGLVCVTGLLALGMLPGCGGGGEGVPSTNGESGGAGPLSNASSATFVAWWFDQTEYLNRQSATDAKSKLLTAERGGGFSTVNELTVANANSDAFVLWSRLWDPRAGTSYFSRYSMADVARQKASPSYDYNDRPLYVRSVSGSWDNAFLSHNARYVAGAWATNNQALGAGQRQLAILELESGAQEVWEPPGGVNEKVDSLLWISDTQFILRNRSGLKFKFTAASGEYLDLPAMPASYNGYALSSEFFAPDGLKVGGLMTRDGGSTYEVWTANLDYSDMRQVTNAGLKLEKFSWLASSTLFKVNLGVPSTEANRCSSAMIDPTRAIMLSAQQLKASPAPGNLETCAYIAGSKS